MQENLLKPEQRYVKIMDLVRQCDFNRSELCQHVGFTVDTSEMIDVYAYVLRRPRIDLAEHREADVSGGEIDLKPDLPRRAPFRNLQITFFGSNFNDRRKDVERFEGELVAVRTRHQTYVQG